MSPWVLPVVSRPAFFYARFYSFYVRPTHHPPFPKQRPHRVLRWDAMSATSTAARVRRDGDGITVRLSIRAWSTRAQLALQQLSRPAFAPLEGFNWWVSARNQQSWAQ